jgi:hypothetical protein
MRQITEVLRLNAQGLSYRQIAQSIGISASTVQSYLERAQRAGLGWPLPDDVDDAALETRLFTRSEEELRPGRPEPNWLEAHRERKRGSSNQHAHQLASVRPLSASAISACRHASAPSAPSATCLMGSDTAACAAGRRTPRPRTRGLHQQQVHPAVVLTLPMLQARPTRRTLARSHTYRSHLSSPSPDQSVTAPTLRRFGSDR